MSCGSISAGDVLPVLPPARGLGRSRGKRESLVGATWAFVGDYTLRGEDL